MTAFFLMYRMNNEYTARGEQPIQGILCLDEEKAAGKLHYLAREWQYFPGKLLTPDMLKENTGYYSRYISIGEYGGMELGDKNASSYGCGTYRMILILPKKEQTWALSLKKVFSAYRIYINGELLSESYGKEAIKDPGMAANSIYLGSDEYFVLGDNRNNSSDSRDPSVGLIKRDQIIGRAWLRIFPFDKIGFVVHGK